MLLLGVTVLAIAVILLGFFVGKMMRFVACIFAIYVVGIVAVSGLCRLASMLHGFTGTTPADSSSPDT